MFLTNLFLSSSLFLTQQVEVNFFANIDKVIDQLATGMSKTGGGIMIISAILFGLGSLFMDDANESFRKAKAWIVKAIVLGIFIFGAGTIASFIQSLMSSGGFGL